MKQNKVCMKIVMFFYCCTLAPTCSHIHRATTQNTKKGHQYWLQENSINIYSAYRLNILWYTAFGNHDYRDSIQAQLDYSKVSRRWRTSEIYFTGHEHALQHQKPIGHTHYFVSGEGSEIRPVTWDSAQIKFPI